MKRKTKGRCPECRRENLYLVKLRTRKNYPFGRNKTGWKHGKKVVVGKKKARVTLVYKRIECFNKNCDYFKEDIVDKNWYLRRVDV